ncbi:MAG: hypothetical protein ACAH95_17415 [Fimbriimonas sp.]
MPRKRKLDNQELSVDPIQPTPDESKAKAPARKAKKVEAETPAPAPAPAKGRAKKAEDAPAPEAAAKAARGRTQRAQEPAIAEVAAVVSEPAQTKPARSRSKKQEATPEVEPAQTEQAPTQVAEPAAKEPRRRIGQKSTPNSPPTSEGEGPGERVRTADQKVAESSRSRGRSVGKKESAEQPAPPEPKQPEETPAEQPSQTRGRNRGRNKQETSAPPVLRSSDPPADSGPPDFLPIPTWRPISKPEKAAKPERTPRGGRPNREQKAPLDLRPSLEATAGPESAPLEFLPYSEDPVIQWRSRGPKTDGKPKQEPKPEREERAPRERRDRKPVTIEAEVAEAIAVAPPVKEAPKPPVKPPIAIPEDAPQVVLRDGIPTLTRNHRVYPPLFFFGNPSDERRAKTVMEEMRMAADAGIHLHAHLIDLLVDERNVNDAVSFAAFLLHKSVEVDPEAQVLFRVVFVAPRGWEDKYPDARYRTSPEPSICDERYWNDAKNCLDQFVRQMRLLELKDHILGLHLDRGEWFLPEDAEYDDSRSAKHMFRDWARSRYLNDQVTLRASWFDGGVSFDNIVVPPYNPQGTEGEKFIRSSRKQRKYVDYHLFLSDITVQRIADLAYTAKAASDGYFLVGASYGYTFEWSHPSSGHLSLGKLLRTPEIDFIAGPPSYRTREPGGAAAFPGPIDSYALNGKLYISEEDFKTSLAIGHEPDDFNPQMRTPQALENVHWRGAGAALAHGGGAAWMDLWGNGWLKTPSVWDRAANVQKALITRMEAQPTDPDVAIFIDERALAYLVDPNAFQLLVQNVRESVLRAGVSAGFYLLSDLAHREKFPESKLYLFLNAWDIRPDLRAAIKSRLQRDNKVLFWLYSAGLFDAGRDSLERAREVTGIALKPQPFHSKSGTTLLNRRHPLSEAFPDRNLHANTQLEPSYFAIPEGATVLGEYTQTGLPSFVVKEFKEGANDMHWTSVFLGEPSVNPALIRALATMAGVHVWNFQDDVVHVRPPFCTVHCTGAGMRTIALPAKYTAYNLQTEEWASDTHNTRFTATDGSTHVFLVGPKEELQHLLDADPKTKLHLEEIPKRDANNFQDGSTFEVPIMRLDEWMGSGDTDDAAEDWFLRAPVITEDPQQATTESEQPGRRRRKRREPRERGGNDFRGEPATARQYDEEIGMSVMFRKRT